MGPRLPRTLCARTFRNNDVVAICNIVHLRFHWFQIGMLSTRVKAKKVNMQNSSDPALFDTLAKYVRNQLPEDWEQRKETKPKEGVEPVTVDLDTQKISFKVRLQYIHCATPPQLQYLIHHTTSLSSLCRLIWRWLLLSVVQYMGPCVFSLSILPVWWLWKYMHFYNYHHQIGRMTHLTLFRVRSWKNGIGCISFCIITALCCFTWLWCRSRLFL